ncbi:MAG: hypothetical protein ACRENE_29545 [Polyangiaceae bacterium]
MRPIFAMSALLGVLAAGAGLGACTADIHDNTVNATIPTSVSITTTADANHVKAGESLPIHAETNQPASATVVAEAGTAATSDAGPAQTQESIVFQIFIDTVSDSPLLVTAQADFSVTLPANLSVGSHKVICRLAHGDGTPTSTMSSIDITVTSG